MFYEAINAISGSLKKRFLHSDLDVVKQIEKFIISAANNIRSNKDDISQRLQRFKSLVCFNALAEELADLHVYIKLYNKESNTPLKKVTKISTVCEILNKKPTSKKYLPEIHKLLQIYFSIALVSTSAERSFSVMRRIKTWLRSSMTDNSFNNQMFASIHKNLLDNINLQTVADDFVKASQIRINYFGLH